MKVAVSPQFPHVLAVLDGIRRRYGDHAGAARSAALAQMLQDFTALLPGQIDVENNQNGRRRGIVAVRFVEKPDGLLAVFDDVEIALDIRGVDRCSDEKHVGGVVFDDQDVPALACLFFRRGG